MLQKYLWRLLVYTLPTVESQGKGLNMHMPKALPGLILPAAVRQKMMKKILTKSFGYYNQTWQQIEGVCGTDDKALSCPQAVHHLGGEGCPNPELHQPQPRGDPGSGLSSPQEPRNGLSKAGEQADAGSAVPPNHHQCLEHIVRRAAVEDKPETDFFGRPLRQQRAAVATAPQASKEESSESQMGKAVGKSDVWFRFNEGVSNAVRRNIYIRDLL